MKSLADKRTKNKGTKLLFNPYRDGQQGELAVDKYGFIPTSVWDIKKSADLVSFVADTFGSGSFKDGGKDAKKGEKNLSLFNPDVVLQILKYYTLEGDIVYAPYGSRGVIGLISYMLGRHSYSCDVVPEYMEDMKQRCNDAKSNLEDTGTIMEFFLCDATTAKVQGQRYLSDESRKIVGKNGKVKSNLADLTFWNPPYWNVEKYKSVDGQMSDCDTYEEFLEQYRLAIEQTFRITAPGGFSVAVVNDIRRDGVFYNFHGDTISICKDVGFLQHDIIVNKLNGRAMQAIGSFEKQGLKIMAKLHEYILVFRKPSESDYRERWKQK